jgi:uncharacterized protein
MLTAETIIQLLNLQPHPKEGGYFRETYRSPVVVPEGRSLATAIYYLLTPETFSEMHKLPGDELFHFYLGDPVEMLHLFPDGSGAVVQLGTDLTARMELQVTVPGGVWQGARLLPVGNFALLGTTMAPGFDYADYVSGNRAELLAGWPAFAELIRALTHDA